MLLESIVTSNEKVEGIAGSTRLLGPQVSNRGWSVAGV